MAAQSSFSAVLKRYRVVAGLSQEALAERAGLSVRTISDLERGLHHAPRPSTIDLLATALALTTQQRAIMLAAACPDLPPPDAPSPNTSASAGGNLPAPSTALLGRDREQTRALDSLDGHQRRLLTLSGPGGVGKTRLALSIAEEFASAFTDGVFFIDLAPIRDPVRLYEVIAQALGLREQPPTLLADTALAYLRDKRMLLLLDNFECALEAAPLVAELLAHCPRICILVTSRIPLRLRGEQRLTLAPLPPDAAAALFRERAQAIHPDREYPQALVEAICERVDRLPLAIELAAIQTRVLPLPQLLDRLSHRLALLRSGARDAPTRQQTMEGTIAWSYDLLDEAQRRCFRALGVFVGGWTLEAAQAVCWANSAANASDALSTLADLVDASLIQAEESPSGAARFHMLELMREFAVARLAEAGEESACRERHARYFSAMADMLIHFGPGQPPHAADPTPELANARVAMEWAERTGEAALGLRLAGFSRLWHVQGHAREAIEWQERMLTLDACVRERDEHAAPLSLRAERLYGLGRTLLGYGEYERAEAAATESLSLAQRAGDANVIGNAYATLGMIAQAHNDYDTAASAFAAAYAQTSPADQGGLRYRVAALLAETERQQGDITRASALLEDALAEAESVGAIWDTACIATTLGSLACQRQRYALATRYYARSLTLFRPFNSPAFSAWCLEGYAAVLSGEGRHLAATRLCAAARATREQARTPAPSAEVEAVDILLAVAQSDLGERAFAAAWRAGATLPRDAAIAEALAECAHRLSEEAPAGEQPVSDV